MEKDINFENNNSNYSKNVQDYLKFINNQSNNINNNKNQLLQFQNINNNYSDNFPKSNNIINNNIYNNNYFNSEQSILKQNNMNLYNNNESNYNFNNNYNMNNMDKSSTTEYDNSKINNSILSEISDNSKHYIHSNNNSNLEIKEKSFKTKNNSKRINYIPKNLITLQNQAYTQRKLNKSLYIPNQDPYISLPNSYYNSILSSEHKNSFDSQNSNHKNSYNYNNSPIFDNDKNPINVNDNEDNGKIFKAFSYIFDANLSDLKEILTNHLFFKNDCPSSIIDNVQFTINNFSDTEGNIISFRWKKFYTLQLMCTKTFSSKTSIAYTLTLINLKPVNIGSLEMNFKYYYNTCQNNTLFIIEYVLDKGILSEVFKEEFLDIDMNEICTNCEKILNSQKKEKSHISSIIFKCPKEKAWDILINSNYFKSLNYMNEYDLLFLPANKNEDKSNNLEKDKNNDKNYIKKGDYIIIKNNKNKKIFAKIVIEDVKNKENENEVICDCKKYNGDDDEDDDDDDDNNNSKENILMDDDKNEIEIVNQKMSFCLKEVTKNLCFCEFKHIWNDNIKDEKIRILNFLKNNSLILFKKDLENKFKKSKNKESNNKDKKEENNHEINLFNLLCPVKK